MEQARRGRSWRFSRRWYGPGLIALTALVRLPALLYRGPIDDEAVYGVVANVMLHGGLPYLDAIERKPPLLFAVYWAVFRAFGAYDWAALHLVMLGWVLLTMLGLFALGQRLFGPEAGALAALGYGVVQPFATAKDAAFNGEVLMNLPIVWGYVLLLGRSGQGLAGVRAATAGAMLALAFLLKQPAAIAAVPLGLYVLAWQDGAGLRRRIGQFALYCGGFAATLGVCALLLLHRGLLADAWYWTVLDHTVPHVFAVRAAEHTALFALFALPLLVPLIRRGDLARAWAAHPAALRAVLGWAAVSVIGVAAGGRFYPHYYIQLLPPLALLAGSFYAPGGAAQREADPARRRLAAAAALWLTASGAVTILVQAAQLFGEDRSSPAAAFVKAHSGPADRLFVWGQATPLYIAADRLPASRYVATFPLTGYIFGERLPGVSTRDRIVPGAWDKLAADLAARRPRFIIDTQTRPGDPYPVADFSYLSGLLAREYRPVATLADGTVYERIAPPPTSGS